MNQTLCTTTDPNDSIEAGQIFAFDVPPEASAEQAARLVDEQPPEGFYAWQVVPWPGVGARVFCKRTKALNPAELAERRRRRSEENHKVKDAEDEQAHAAVARIIARSPMLTIGRARARLAGLGFRRGNDWVAESVARAKTKA